MPSPQTTVQNLTRMGLVASVLLLLGVLLCQARHDPGGGRERGPELSNGTPHCPGAGAWDMSFWPGNREEPLQACWVHYVTGDPGERHSAGQGGGPGVPGGSASDHGAHSLRGECPYSQLFSPRPEPHLTWQGRSSCLRLQALSSLMRREPPFHACHLWCIMASIPSQKQNVV